MKNPNAVHAAKSVPREQAWHGSVSNTQSQSPLWEPCPHEGCRLSLQGWQLCCTGQREQLLVFDMSDHNLLICSVSGLKNTVEMKMQELAEKSAGVLSGWCSRLRHCD